MKKGLKIFFGVILFLFVALLTLPFLFKDKIIAKINTELENTIDAQVLFNADKFSISLIRNFPNVSITLGDFGLIGKKAEFKGDTLYYAETTRLVADIMSVIKGDKISVKKIYLKRPIVRTIMTETGMSWDIAVASPEDTVAAPAEEPSAFNIGLESWEIEDGVIIYDDRTLPMYAELRQMNHKGKGDLTQEVFDMETVTSSPQVLITFDGVTYLKNHSLDADMKINMNYDKMEFRFLENEIKINNFIFGFDGMLAMPNETDIVYDLTYKAKETEFKNLISLIPAVFMTDYKGLKTEGKIAFDGMVKGIQNETSLPAFSLNLNIDNAMMQYPSLPTAVKNIILDMSVTNSDGVIDNTVIDIRKFHMDMGSNPVDARVLVRGLEPYNIDANVAARINLGEITKMFPIEGTELRGLYNLDVKAKGAYSDAKKLMPVVDARMSMKDGFVKTADLPSALENINFNASVNSAGDMASTKALLENFSMLMDGEPFEARASVENLDNAKYDVNVKGRLDMEKLTKLYPLDDMTVSGIINADITTKGVMSDVEAGRYEKTSTSGIMSVSNLNYVSTDMPQGMKLSSANFTLTPERMVINNMEGFLGKSDISVKGYFANYMGYMFGTQDTVIKGQMTFYSRKFDVNEWMTEEETAAAGEPAAADTVPFEVPGNIDFILLSTLGEVLYDNMVMKDMKGTIVMKNSIVRMSDLTFKMLGGGFLMNGSYNTQNIKRPLFDYDMKIDKVQIKEAFQTFNTVQTFAPAAKDMEGTFSTTMKLGGVLGNDMMPKYETMNGAGTLKVEEAQLKGNKVLTTISTVTSVKNLDPLTIKDVVMKFKISEGKLVVEPYDLTAGNIKMNIGGSTTMEGQIDYKIKMDVPAGAAGSALANLTGKPADPNQTVRLDLKVTGNYNQPKVGLEGGSLKDQAADAIKDAVKDRVKEELKTNPEIQKAKEDAERLRKETEEKLKAEQERLKKEAEEKLKREAEERLKKEAEERLKKESEPAKKEAEKILKDNIKLPKLGK